MRRLIKKLVVLFFYLAVLPVGLPCRLLYKWFNIRITYHFWAQFLSLIPDPIGQFSRAAFYNQTLDQAPLNFAIYFGSLITKPETRIGDFVSIGGFTTIGKADINDHAIIANHVSLLSGRQQHNFNDADRKLLDGDDCFDRIYIGCESFIGDNSTVMADVGDHSIVGAGSVVIKPVPDMTVAVGNPAKVVKNRRDDLAAILSAKTS